MCDSFDIQENGVGSEEFSAYAKDVTKVVCNNDETKVSISFVSDKKMREMNQTFRGKDSSTDVLSFPFKAEEFEDENFLGDVAISIEQAKRQALENSLPTDVEIKQLILHGVLHLCGYDHETDEGEMNSLEMKFRDKLGIN